VSPRLDFVVLPISESLVTQLKKLLGRPGVFNVEGVLIHVQVEVNGALAFGAYDNFHRDCVRGGSVLTESLLQEWVTAGVLRSYAVV